MKVWKLNIELLKNKNFVAAVIDLFEQIGRTTEHIVKWGLFKQDLKQIAIERASVIKFQKSETERTLISNLRANWFNLNVRTVGGVWKIISA